MELDDLRQERSDLELRTQQARQSSVVDSDPSLMTKGSSNRDASRLQ